jgi:Rod binding domain-containing protein
MSLPIEQLGTALQAAHAQAKATYTREKGRLTKATQDFEAVFVGMMLKQMRKSMAGDNAIFGNSSEAKIYQDMMDDGIAQQLSKSGTFGLSGAMMKSAASRLPPDPDAYSAVKKL